MRQGLIAVAVFWLLIGGVIFAPPSVLAVAALAVFVVVASVEVFAVFSNWDRE